MGNISEANIKEWERAFTVNVTGTLRLIQAALPERRKTKGRIIFVSSGVAVVGYPTLGPYGATKFVVNHLALQLTKEEPHVMAVAVRPGMVDTEMVGEILLDERADEEFKGVRKMAIEQGTMVEADELWRVIARLALWAGEKLRGDFVR